MIIEKTPLSMAEATEYISKDSEADTSGFIKKFTKMKADKARELKKKLQELDLMKLKEEHIVKIIDLMPKTSEELNKIFVDMSLDEDEKKKILDTIKEFK